MSSEFPSLIAFVEVYLSEFSVLSGELTALTLLTAFAVLSAIEFSHPERSWPLESWRQSYQTNAGLFIFNSFFISLLPAMLLSMPASRYSERGLLSPVEGPAWKALQSFVLEEHGAHPCFFFVSFVENKAFILFSLMLSQALPLTRPAWVNGD